MAMELLEKEWFIEAPWGRICIVAFGDCTDPPVLLCHGMVDSANTFKPILRLLPRNFYYVAMEIPGNGRSDPFPPGLNLSVYDMVYAVRVVVKHFRWEHFYYMAHSLGTMIGKYYNLSYPAGMTRVIELEPTPNMFSTVDAKEFASWYHQYFSGFFAKYDKLNSTKEKAPLYSKAEALEMCQRNRGLTDDAAALVLARNTENVDKLNIRFTFDQRTKQVFQPPLTPAHKQRLFTSIPTPTLAIVARVTIQMGLYDTTPFCLNEKLHMARNYRVRVVEGHHDVHLSHPERLAGFVAAFLEGGLDGFDRRAKL